MQDNIKYMVGSRVKKVNKPYYIYLDISGIPNETVGTVIKVIKRYKTPETEHCLYYIQFDNYPITTVDNIYNEYDEDGLSAINEMKLFQTC